MDILIKLDAWQMQTTASCVYIWYSLLCGSTCKYRRWHISENISISPIFEHSVQRAPHSHNIFDRQLEAEFAHYPVKHRKHRRIADSTIGKWKSAVIKQWVEVFFTLFDINDSFSQYCPGFERVRCTKNRLRS